MKVGCLFLLSIFSFMFVKGDWPAIADQCCKKGNSLYRYNRQTCPSINPSLVDIPKQYKEMCLSIINICCMMNRTQNFCNSGVEVAMTQHSCTFPSRKFISEDERECCHCCNLGITISKLNLPCDIQVKSIDQRCQSKLTFCCSTHHQPTTKKYKLVQQVTKPFAENFCGAYPEKLCSHICENVPGSFKCRCREGFELLSDNKNCKQIENFCGAYPEKLCSHICENVPGSFKCRCREGFELLSDNINCKQIEKDECQQENICKKNEKCIKLNGSYRCEARNKEHLCGTGFTYNDSRLSCEDINECLDGRKCRDNEICTNTKGSYLCVKLQNSSCSLGFYFNNVTKKCEDFNECMTALENCPMGMKCINTHGSYTCKRARECGTGYKLNTVTDECEDIDECVLNIHNCGKSRTCKNIAGSFRCLTTDCAKGHKFSEIFQVCEPIVCRKGMELNNKDECIDVDECLKIPQICPQKKVCKNTYGSYKCVDEMVCPAGFFLNETKNGCLDINECGTSLHSCTYKNMLCNNTIGSYICYCPSGTETNKVLRECVDINECTQKISACSAHTTCENTFGSYRCVCRDGFRLEGNECKDDNECARKETCQHICTNVWGSFRCSCKPGYKLAADNRSCQDLDECKIYSLMKGKEACRYNCTNEVGSFNCSCPPGYHMTSNFKCVDIDECNKAVKPCDNNKICINLKGSFKCEETDCGSFYNRNVKEDSTNVLVECNKKTCNRGDSRCLSSPFVIQYFFLSFSTDIPIPYAITQLTMPQDSANLFQSKLTNFKSSIQKPYLGSVDKNYFQLTKSYFQGKSVLIIEIVKKINEPQDISFDVVTELIDPDSIITFVTRMHVYITKKFFD